MRANKFRELLKADKPTIGTHIHTTWPSIVEAIGHTGTYDYVEFVAEYGPFDLYAFDDMCRAAELYDMSMMVKVDQEPRGFIAQRAIGSGFQSVLFSDCRSADEVRECVAIARPETPEDGRHLWRGDAALHLHGLRRLHGLRAGAPGRRGGHHDRERRRGAKLGRGAVGAGRRHDPVGRFGLLHERRASPASAARRRSRPSSAR